MKNYIIPFSAIALLVAACSSNAPAPYEVYGSRYYGKNGPAPVYADNISSPNSNSTIVRSHPILNQPGDYAANDYNQQIDQQNSERVISRPLNSQKPGEVYSHQVADNSGISVHPLPPVPIDGNQQVVPLTSMHQPIHSGGSLGSSYIAQNNNLPLVQPQETVPPVEKKDGFVNPSQVNSERKAADNLSKIKPVPKPKQQEEAEVETITPAPVQPATAPKTAAVAAAKPKIVSRVAKIETASGEIDKSTPAMVNSTPEEDDTVDDSEKAADEKPVAATKKAVESIPLVKGAADDENAEDSNPAPAATATAAAKPAAAKSNAQFIKPVDGVVIGEFGNDKNGGAFNDGINIQAPEGTPVKAASGGTVVYSGNQLQGYGNMIIIRHPNGFLSAYSHLKELDLKKGQAVSQGDIVGHVGKTGNVDTPQLHFGLRKGREPVDPKDYL